MPESPWKKFIAAEEPHLSATTRMELTLNRLARIAIGTADRNRNARFQNGPLIMKASIAARANNEIRLLMPLHGVPMAKLALGISIWLLVIMVGIPNTLTADAEDMVTMVCK